MPTNARSYGANARRLDWEDEVDAQSAGRTGSWMPLDGLEDELFTAGPQLRAVVHAAPSQEAALPWRREKHQERIAPTRPQPKAQTQAHAAPRTAPQPRAEKAVEARAVMLMAGAAALLVAVYAIISAGVEWTQVKLDDLQYGRPRTMQMDAYVGHAEAEGVPSHFVAMNLNRRVTILEMPGSDSSKVNTIVGPYLFGQGEDLTPVKLGSTDVNADGLADLIVSVKNEQLLYLNDGAAFRLATTEERLAIEQAAQNRPVPTEGGNGASEEAGR